MSGLLLTLNADQIARLAAGETVKRLVYWPNEDGPFVSVRIEPGEERPMVLLHGGHWAVAVTPEPTPAPTTCPRCDFVLSNLPEPRPEACPRCGGVL